MYLPCLQPVNWSVYKLCKQFLHRHFTAHCIFTAILWNFTTVDTLHLLTWLFDYWSPIGSTCKMSARTDRDVKSIAFFFIVFINSVEPIFVRQSTCIKRSPGHSLWVTAYFGFTVVAERPVKSIFIWHIRDCLIILNFEIMLCHKINIYRLCLSTCHV